MTSPKAVTAEHLDAAVSWACAQVRPHTSSEIEVDAHRVRSWSATARLNLASGEKMWVKQSASGFAFEGALTALLAETMPHFVHAPLVLDMDNGRMLTSDYGPPRADVGPLNLEEWKLLVIEYARMQLEAMPLVPAARELGVPSPALADFLKAVTAAALPSHGSHRLSVAEHRSLLDLAGLVDASFARAASSRVPATIDHHDPHPGNVLLDGHWFDFGDATIAHPFVALPVLRSHVAEQLAGGDLDSDKVRAVTDIYLETFYQFGSVTQLREEAAFVAPLAHVSAAAVWLRLPPGVRARHFPGALPDRMRMLKIRPGR